MFYLYIIDTCFGQKLTSPNPAHFTMTWKSRSYMSENTAGISIKVNNGMVQQVVTPDIMNLIFDTLKDKELVSSVKAQLPPSKVLGKGTIELTDLRIRKARITGLKGSKKGIKVVENVGGTLMSKGTGSGVGGRDISKTSAPLIRIQKDHLTVQIVGLNLEMSSNFRLETTGGSDQNKKKSGGLTRRARTSLRTSKGSKSSNSDTGNKQGKFWMRMIDCVSIFDLSLGMDPATSKPIVKVLGTPKIYWGKFQLRFDKTKLASISPVLQAVQKIFKNRISNSVGKVISLESRRISDILGKYIYIQVNRNLIYQLNKYKLEPDLSPRVTIEDFQWSVVNYEMILRMNLIHNLAQHRQNPVISDGDIFVDVEEIKDFETKKNDKGIIKEK